MRKLYLVMGTMIFLSQKFQWGFNFNFLFFQTVNNRHVLNANTMLL